MIEKIITKYQRIDKILENIKNAKDPFDFYKPRYKLKNEYRK